MNNNTFNLTPPPKFRLSRKNSLVKTRHQAAFTLAEILITLSIIGVVGALTIPGLIFKNNEKQTVVRLKKAYSIASQMYATALIQAGPPEGWGWAGEFSPQGALNLSKTLFSLLNTTRLCEPEINGCWMESDGLFATGADAILNDGSSFRVTSRTLSCPASQNIIQCGDLIVDLNGPKKPNIYGKDVFIFMITNNGVFPRGLPKDEAIAGINLKSCRESGRGCAAWVLYKENMDYLKREVSWDE